MIDRVNRFIENVGAKGFEVTVRDAEIGGVVVEGHAGRRSFARPYPDLYAAISDAENSFDRQRRRDDRLFQATVAGLGIGSGITVATNSEPVFLLLGRQLFSHQLI